MVGAINLLPQVSNNDKGPKLKDYFEFHFYFLGGGEGRFKGHFTHEPRAVTLQL